MQQWDYEALYLDQNSTWRTRDETVASKVIIDALRIMGDRGWELITEFTGGPDDAATLPALIFKRPRQPAVGGDSLISSRG